ncbi:MAG: hypothetical protein FJW27_01850 [Acidimicrobiia bacterium]|nr:hypothetical protein [Acidimicrobiia bacterium]
MSVRRSSTWIRSVLFSVAVVAVLAPLAAGQRLLLPRPFPVAELFLELNNTDGDLGMHSNLDGGGWTQLEVEGPSGRPLLGIVTTGPLRRQALTQLSFESTEPPFDELDPDVFFRRFPEGTHEISARAQDQEYESRVYLSHVLAAPAEATVPGQPAAESCTSEPLPEVSGPVLIDWQPVTASHPELGRPGQVTISRYQLFVQQDDTKLSLDLRPDVTEFEIPASLTVAGGVFKFEIIARTTTGNNTAIESCFRVPKR